MSSATNIDVYASDGTKLKTVAQWNGDYKQTDYGRNRIDEKDKSRSSSYSCNFWVVAAISGIEWEVALGISVADYIWIDNFHNWIDEKTEGN